MTLRRTANCDQRGPRRRRRRRCTAPRPQTATARHHDATATPPADRVACGAAEPMGSAAAVPCLRGLIFVAPRHDERGRASLSMPVCVMGTTPHTYTHTHTCMWPRYTTAFYLTTGLYEPTHSTANDYCETVLPPPRAQSLSHALASPGFPPTPAAFKCVCVRRLAR